MRKTHLLATMFCPRLGNESIILGLHGLNPLWILESSGDSSRFRDRIKKNGGDAISRVGFDDVTFRSCFHGIMV